MQLLIHALTSTVVLSTVEVKSWMSEYIPLICMEAITYPSSNFADGLVNLSKAQYFVSTVAQDPLDLGCDQNDSPVVKLTNFMLFYIRLFFHMKQPNSSGGIRHGIRCTNNIEN